MIRLLWEIPRDIYRIMTPIDDNQAAGTNVTVVVTTSGA